MTTLDELRKLSATHSQSEAARALGITRQRVSQLARRHGLTFRSGWKTTPRKPCIVCGLPLRRRPKWDYHFACVPRETFTCKRCGRSFTVRKSSLRYGKRVYCGRDCPGLQKTYPCIICGAPVRPDTYQRANLKRKKSRNIMCKRCTPYAGPRYGLALRHNKLEELKQKTLEVATP